MKPNDFLRQATQLVAGERNRQHGDKRANHDNIAEIWSAYLKRLTGVQDLELGAENVATMMVLLKVARTLAGEFNEDDYVDMIGYAAIAGELAHGDANGPSDGELRIGDPTEGEPVVLKMTPTGGGGGTII